MLTFDLKTNSRRNIVRELRKLEVREGPFTTTNEDRILKIHPLVLTDQPLDPNSIQGLAQFDRKLATIVQEGKMGITGANLLGQQFRDNLSAVKDKLAKASTDMNSAMSELKDTADQATDMVKQVEAETADLKAALGLSSNNPS